MDYLPFLARTQAPEEEQEYSTASRAHALMELQFLLGSPGGGKRKGNHPCGIADQGDSVHIMTPNIISHHSLYLTLPPPTQTQCNL